MTVIKRQVDIDLKEHDYEKAKAEDRLHDAIRIRDHINRLRKDIEDITDEIITSWTSKSPEGHFTIQQMQEQLVDKLGTKKVYPNAHKTYNSRHFLSLRSSLISNYL